MKPTWPRYRIEYSFFPFLKHLLAWIRGFIPQSHLFLLAYSDGLQDRVWLPSLAVSIRHSGNQWSLNEQGGEWQRKRRVSVVIIRTKGKERQEQRLKTMLHCLLSNWGMAKQPLKFMDQKIWETLREISILSCFPRTLHEVSQEGIKSLTLHDCVLEKGTYCSD